MRVLVAQNNERTPRVTDTIMSTIRYKSPSYRAVLHWGLAAIGPPVKRRPDSKSVVISMGALDLFPQLRSGNRWRPNHAWTDRDGIPCREPLTAPVGTSLTAPIAEGCRHVDAQLRAPALGGNCAHERPTPSCPACKLAEFAGNRGMPVPNYLSSVGHIRRSDRQAEGASWPHLATEVDSIRGRNPGTQATGAGNKRASPSYARQAGSSQVLNDGSCYRDRIFLRASSTLPVRSSRRPRRARALGSRHLTHCRPDRLHRQSCPHPQPIRFTTASPRTRHRTHVCPRFDW